MFTGIIDHCGKIVDVQTKDDGLIAWVETRYDDLVAGESIAVDGICLTVTDPQRFIFRVDISPETLSVTTAHQFKKGVQVNLERALRIGDRLGGHFVMGHVDQTCRVAHKHRIKEFIELNFQGVKPAAQRYFLSKGSVAINGVSLTLNQVIGDEFQVMLIPHTLEKTNLDLLNSGSLVNVEYDWLTKVVAQQVHDRLTPTE